ncbi:hypothetical protein H2200_011981 [Cladophialophora chaetospira]|uniref:SnoaL-like domain-containing protein n=1 Tax=Cladophialophora chaetospira TaxID=386627 RepID=A0AA38WZ41_9EURO|nr:hypothetical protein H2200_011981 [Cladophialophora chaetospira]
MSTSTQQLQRLADELEIRSLVARFANACNPPNLEAFGKLWVPDTHQKGEWSLSEPFTTSATGVDDIVTLLDKLLQPWDFFVQLVHSGVVDIDGDEATGRFIMHEVAKGPNETYYNNFAIYEDKYCKVDGKWFFAKRHYNYMFLDSGPFGGNVCPPIEGWFSRK